MRFIQRDVMSKRVVTEIEGTFANVTLLVVRHAEKPALNGDAGLAPARDEGQAKNAWTTGGVGRRGARPLGDAAFLPDSKGHDDRRSR